MAVIIELARLLVRHQQEDKVVQFGHIPLMSLRRA
jgi:hypothetical protein